MYYFDYWGKIQRYKTLYLEENYVEIFSYTSYINCVYSNHFIYDANKNEAQNDQSKR